MGALFLGHFGEYMGTLVLIGALWGPLLCHSYFRGYYRYTMLGTVILMDTVGAITVGALWLAHLFWLTLWTVTVRGTLLGTMWAL